jgi:hypothetical protein
MTAPSPDPTPDDQSRREPDRSDGLGSPALSPEQKRTALQEGRERLTSCFRISAPLKGWSLFTEEQITELKDFWSDALRAYSLYELDSETPGALNELQVHFLSAAEDDDAIYFLVCLEDTAQVTAVAVGQQNKLVPLSYGAHVARLIALPRSSSPEILESAVDLETEDSPVGEMLLIDPQSIALEARRLGAGDLSGLLGDLFLASLEDAKGEATLPENSWEISPGCFAKEERGFYSFAFAGKESGSYFFDIQHEPGSNFLIYSLCAPRAPQNSPPASQGQRIPQGTLVPSISPARALHELGYHEIESLPVPGGSPPAEIFQNGIRSLLKDWAPSMPWRVQYEACFAKPSDPEGKILIHASVRGGNNAFLLPFLKGNACVVSSKALGLLIEARREQVTPTTVRLCYQPRMVFLGPQGQLEDFLAQSLTDLPNSLLGAFALSAIKQHLDKRSIKWLSGNNYGHVLSSLCERDETCAGLLCFHLLGAHKLLIQTLAGGLLDLATGVQPQVLYPELPPF